MEKPKIIYIKGILPMTTTLGDLAMIAAAPDFYDVKFKHESNEIVIFGQRDQP